MQVARKYQARAGNVTRLFARAPGLQNNGVFLAASAGFSIDDAEVLTDLACEAELDLDDGGRCQAAPLHALHALMRLGEPALAPAAPRLIARALALRCDAGDYVTELVSESLKAALIGCGASALPLLTGALLTAARSSADWRGEAWLGFGVLSRAVAALPFSLGELAAGDAAAAAVLDAIDAVYAQWRSAASPPRDARRCLSSALSGLLDVAGSLAPFFRAGHAARTLRLLRAIKLDRGPRNVGAGAPGDSFSFAGFLGAMGLEPAPGDPALAGVSVSTAADVAAMWKARHGAGTRPPGPPYPGESGYEPPSIWSADGALQWALPMRCGYALCGMDIDALATGIAGVGDGASDPMAIMAAFMAAMERKSQPGQIAKLQACAACRAMAYCSPKCQKADWAVSKAARKDARARKGIDESAEDFPHKMDVSALLGNHKMACPMTTLLIARARPGPPPPSDVGAA